MDTIRLKPKYQEIEKLLIRNNSISDNVTMTFVKLNAHMIAQGLQLSEEYEESKK